MAQFHRMNPHTQHKASNNQQLQHFIYQNHPIIEVVFKQYYMFRYIVKHFLQN